MLNAGKGWLQRKPEYKWWKKKILSSINSYQTQWWSDLGTQYPQILQKERKKIYVIINESLNLTPLTLSLYVCHAICEWYILEINYSNLKASGQRNRLSILTYHHYCYPNAPLRPQGSSFEQRPVNFCWKIITKERKPEILCSHVNTFN